MKDDSPSVIQSMQSHKIFGDPAQVIILQNKFYILSYNLAENYIIIIVTKSLSDILWLQLLIT